MKIRVGEREAILQALLDILTNVTERGSHWVLGIILGN